MSKNTVKAFLVVLTLCLLSKITFANGSHSSNIYAWDQNDPNHNTINDWKKVGSMGYAAYFQLTSNTANPNNGGTFSQGNPDFSLRWDTASTSIVAPTGAWAGYEFTLPANVPLQRINWAQLSGFWNFVNDGTISLRVTDGQGHVLWSSNPTDLANSSFSVTAPLSIQSRTVRIIVKVADNALWGAWFWAGNSAFVSPFQLKTVEVSPVCGDEPYNPYPVGDLNKDCVVNLADFAILLSHWLEDSMLPPPPKEHLSLFGYYMVSVDDGTPPTNFIPQVCANAETNFNQMDWTQENVDDTEACSSKMKMVVNLCWQFFDAQNKLRSDYITNWNNLAAQIAPHINTVGAFLLENDPYWNGISKSDLETVALLVKNTFPNTPTMVVEAYPMITDNLQMPAGIDYYGFDYFGMPNGFTEIPRLLAIIKSKLRPGQQIILVPENILFNSTDAQVASYAYDYYNLALSEESVVGMEVFLWPDLSTGHGAPAPMLTLAGPLTLAAFNDIGHQIHTNTKPKIFFPSSYSVNEGQYSSGNAASLKNYDADYLTINSTASSSAPTDFDINNINISAPSKIKVRVNTKSTQNAAQTIQFWNYSTSSWDTKDSATATASPTVRDTTIINGASNYINNTNLRIRIKATAGSSFSFSYEQIAVLIYNDNKFTKCGYSINAESSAVIPVPVAYDWWTARQAVVNERVKQSKVDILFIGDSITHFWDSYPDLWQKYFGKWSAVNAGFGGDMTQNALWRLQHGTLDGYEPKLCVIMIGTNNSNGDMYTAQEIADGIKAIVCEIKTQCPDSKILLLAIFPRGQYPSAQRDKNALASSIASSIADNKTVYYMDINNNFLDANGIMSVDVMPDYLHPNANGYAIWGDAVAPMIENLMSQ